jgi:23S rRNA G2445 N2-methylase RlmL
VSECVSTCIPGRLAKFKIFATTFKTIPGLEPLLAKEIRSLAPVLLVANDLRHGVVMAQQSPLDSPLELSDWMDDALGKVHLKAWLTNSVYSGMRFPSECNSTLKLEKQVSQFPWGRFFQKGSPVPDIRIKLKEEGSLRTKEVRAILNESFTCFAGNHDPDIGHSPSIEFSNFSGRPSISVDSSGSLLNNLSYSPFSKSSRLSLTEVSAAAIMQRAVIPIIESTSSQTIVWDPFCASGVSLFVLAKMIAGIPPGSPAVPYPFRSYPSHNPQSFQRLVDGISLTPLRCSGRVSLVGTDSSQEAVEVSKLNMAKFTASLPSTGVSPIGFDFSFSRVCDAYTPPGGSDKLLIVTALPTSGDVERKYKHFHSMLDSLRRESRLVGCVVTTNKSRIFRATTKEKWLVKQRFFDSRRELELLELVIS